MPGMIGTSFQVEARDRPPILVALAFDRHAAGRVRIGASLVGDEHGRRRCRRTATVAVDMVHLDALDRHLLVHRPTFDLDDQGNEEAHAHDDALLVRRQRCFGDDGGEVAATRCRRCLHMNHDGRRRKRLDFDSCLSASVVQARLEKGEVGSPESGSTSRQLPFGFWERSTSRRLISLAPEPAVLRISNGMSMARPAGAVTSIRIGLTMNPCANALGIQEANSTTTIDGRSLRGRLMLLTRKNTWLLLRS